MGHAPRAPQPLGLYSQGTGLVTLGSSRGSPLLVPSQVEVWRWLLQAEGLEALAVGQEVTVFSLPHLVETLERPLSYSHYP